MNTRPLSCWMSALLIGFLSIGGLPSGADERHDAEPAQTSGQANPLPAQSPSLLQVTGTANRFDILASHADVQSVLSAIFAQAHRQFVPDSSVTGDVSLVLTGQTFDVVLSAVCKRTFLRYDVDRHNIYQFQRDDQALRESFARIRVLNAAIADQLRRLGITVPAQSRNEDRFAAVQGGFGGGGFAGRDAANLPNKLNAPQGAPPNAKSQRDKADQAQSRLDAKDASPALRSNMRSLAQGGIGDRGPQGPQGPGGQAQNGVIANASQASLAPYDQLLHDNGLVGIHATREQPVPIPDVLQRFGRQASVPILIDPALDREHMLRFFGTIVRPLPEAMNILLPLAHLEWRYVGNSIFVTEAPDFGIFYGISNVPRAVYPSGGQQPSAPPAAKSRQQDANGPADAPRPNKQPSKQGGN